ncbi:MAG: BrxA/BrxB family bacilliredoxin [Flavobacteriales bacterium]|nr:BrxA/BrxB family bacilliredoxin [Flavobacteriales bacterium]
MYPKEIVLPMKNELTERGFKDIDSPENVENNIKDYKTSLFVINSVCGCSASSARPGVVLSLQNEVIPKNLATVFAGFDIESTKKLREFLVPFPPSSPAIALFKDGELVHMLERHHIEGHTAEAIAENLKQAYNEYCVE